MKRWIAFAMAAALLLGLCACAQPQTQQSTTASTEAPQQGGFMAGFSKVDITPYELGVPMGGYGNEAVRLSSGLLSYIYAITVALTDAEGNTAILMSVDSCGVDAGICTEVRQWAQLFHGIPVENILISAIHQHSTPVASSELYREELVLKLQDGITRALEDRAPAEMYTNKVTTEAMNFVRRCWAKDGSFVTSHSGNRSAGIAGYESESDKEMRLIKFTRQQKDDIIMVNFQCHPHMGTKSSDSNIHSDWPGIMRDQVNQTLGAQCIYFSGAGGNLNSTSYIDADEISTDYRHHGQRAAEYVIGAEDGYTKAETGRIVCMEKTVAYDADHSMDHLLPVASLVHEVRKNEGMAAAHEAVKAYPELNSAYQATAIVVKADLGPTKDVTISVVTFGDVAFTVHPYEMFDTNGMELRGGTVGNENYDAEDQLENPFPMTFVTTKSNGGVGYIPSTLGYTNGGYEADTTKYAKGTGEKIVGDVLQMLNQIG